LPSVSIGWGGFSSLYGDLMPCASAMSGAATSAAMNS